MGLETDENLAKRPRPNEVHVAVVGGVVVGGVVGVVVGVVVVVVVVLVCQIAYPLNTPIILAMHNTHTLVTTTPLRYYS